jgi:hypothetical protein
MPVFQVMVLFIFCALFKSDYTVRANEFKSASSAVILAYHRFGEGQFHLLVLEWSNLSLT